MRLLFTLLVMAVVTLIAAALMLVDLLVKLLPLLLVAAAVLMAAHWPERRRRAAHIARPKSLPVMRSRRGVSSLHHSVIGGDDTDSRRSEPVGWVILPVWGRQRAPRRQVVHAEMIRGRVRRD